MQFSTPSLKDLIAQADADIAAELKGDGKLLRRSFLKAMARAQAGLAFLMFAFLRRYIENAFPWSAKGYWLRKWASWWSGYAPKEAAYSIGPVAITGAAGAILPQDTLFQSRAGLTYLTQADAPIVAGVATVQVKAVEPGIAGNLAEGAALSLVSPVAGINADALVAAGGIANGADAETEEAFRARWNRHVQRRTNNSTVQAYVDRALEVPGCTRAWAYENRDGAGTVAVFFVRDNDVSIIPDAAAIAQMLAYLIDPVRKPVGAEVFVYAPVAVPLNLTIQLTPNTLAVKAQVKAETDDLVKREAELGGTIPLSQINESISLADGETDHVLQLPVATPVVLSNQLLVPGVITWVP